MKNLSCSGPVIFTALLAFATTACSDNTGDRTNPATTATSSSVGSSAGSGEASSEYMLDPTGSGTGE